MSVYKKAQRRRREEENETKEQAKQYREYCKAESDEAYTTSNKNQEEYDKQLLTLSTGLLAILIAFLKDLVRLPEAVFKPLLYISLGLLSLTIALVLFSFQFSSYVLEEVRAFWKSEYEGTSNSGFPDVKAKQVQRVNRCAGACFALGIAFSIGFITINLSHEAKMTQKNQQQINEGQVPKIPIDGENRGMNAKVPQQPSKVNPPKATTEKK